jgi:membrane protease YdiL (CAAX protease family)
VNGRPGTGRLVAWCCVVGVIAALQFTARVEHMKPAKSAFYSLGNAAANGAFYVFLFMVVLLLAMGLPKRPIFALRRPDSWRRAAYRCSFVLVALVVLSWIVGLFANPTKEQGIVPTYWDRHRVVGFAANLVVVALVAPLVEELLFRGLGFSLLERFGRRQAVVLVGIAFGLWHGLLVGLPLLIAFGTGLAWVRARTGSVYPGMVLHGLFNAAAVIFSVLSSSSGR